MRNSVYENLDIFMVRTPTFAIENFFNFFDEKYDEEKNLEDIRNLCKDPVFRESILIGSKNLYSTLKDFCDGKNIKKQKYFLQSIYKYLIRMSTRPTPFGLFSGVDFGRYSEDNTVIKYADSKYKKYARPDIDWLIELVKFIEEKEYINLKYKVNDSIFKKGDRAFLLYSTRKEQEDSDVAEISVRLTNPLERVLEFAKESISYKDLKGKLIDEYGKNSKEKIDFFLENLIKNEYLISNLTPPLTIDDQFHYIIKELDELEIEDDLKNKLVGIKEMIETYMKTNLGEGEALYENICNKMKTIVSSKNVLQVDMKLNLKEKTLSKKVIEEINDLLNMLLTISTPYKERDSYFKRYKQQYIERYGENREIPLLEMIDNDRGISAPIEYTHPKTNRHEYITLDSKINEKIKRYFADKYIDAVKNKKSITITDKEIKKLQLEEYSYEEVPNSMEMNLIIKAESKGSRNNNNFKYYIGPNLGSDCAGKSFGRFSYMMGEEKECFHTLAANELERNKDNEYVTCELVYLPSKVRAANVSRNVHGSEYEIALFTNNSKEYEHRLSLNDIVIGIENDKFYAKSKVLNKKLIVTMNNMLNKNFAPNSIRFLNEIESDGSKLWYAFPWKTIFNYSTYIPKVQYKNFTISPSIWRLNKEFLEINNKTSFETFKRVIQNYFEKYDISQYVYIALEDNRILLNTKDPRSLEILQHEINNNDVEIILNSYEEEVVNVVTDSEEKEYVCEVVIPLVKIKKEQQKVESIKKRINGISSLSADRLKVPFDQWLYLKLYGITSNVEDLIAFHISEYAREKIDKGEINRYFFMRYADPIPHIRLRLNSTKEQLLNLYPEIEEWLKDLMNKGLMDRFTIDSYDREIERYGGMELMDIAESVFYFDSMVVEDILREKSLHNIKFSKELIGMISIIHFMENYGVAYEAQVVFLRAQSKISEYRKDFNKNRKEYMELCNSSNDWQTLRTTDEGILLLNILNKRSQMVTHYSEKIKECLQYSDKFSILNSVLHLHCNRLFGIDREFETKVRVLASHTLYALKYIKNNEL